MTGFLCALGGVCLSQRSKPCGPTTYSPPPMGPMSERKYSMVSVGVCEVSAAGASATCSSSSSTETPLGRFPDRLLVLLVLLVCGHERVGLHVRTNIKELLGLELSPVLYHMLFNKLRNSIGSFLGNTLHAIQMKTKLCQLVEVMMERRDDLSFCKEMKFR